MSSEQECMILVIAWLLISAAKPDQSLMCSGSTSVMLAPSATWISAIFG
jgi:hypothetical protein